MHHHISIGLSQFHYQDLINQINTITYNFPFDSKTADFSGINANSDGTPAIEVDVADSKSGTMNAVTIAGALNAIFAECVESKGQQ